MKKVMERTNVETEIQNINEIKPIDEPISKTEEMLLESFFPLKTNLKNEIINKCNNRFNPRTILLKVVLLTILSSIFQTQIVDKLLNRYKLNYMTINGIKIGIFAVLCFAILYFG